MTLPKLIGGSHDGDIVDSSFKINGIWWPSVLYFAAIITIEESNKLAIDDVRAWRHPDDVYEFDKTNYVFRERIDYKPKGI